MNQLSKDLIKWLFVKNSEKCGCNPSPNLELLNEVDDFIEFLESQHFLYSLQEENGKYDSVEPETSVDSFYNYIDTWVTSSIPNTKNLADYFLELRRLKNFRKMTLTLLYYNQLVKLGKMSSIDLVSFDLERNQKDFICIKENIEAMIFTLMNDPFAYFEEKEELSNSLF